MLADLRRGATVFPPQERVEIVAGDVEVGQGEGEEGGWQSNQLVALNVQSAKCPAGKEKRHYFGSTYT